MQSVQHKALASKDNQHIPTIGSCNNGYTKIYQPLIANHQIKPAIHLSPN